MRKWWEDNSGSEVITCIILVAVVMFYYYFRADLKNSDCYTEGVLLYTNSRWDIALGRWLTPICLGITWNIVNPVLFLVCHYLCVAFATVTLIDVWGISDRAIRIVTGAVMAAAPAIVGQAMYIHEMPTYTVSLFFAFISVFLLVKKEGLVPFFVAVLCFTIALGAFQSIIGTVLFTLLGYLAIRALDPDPVDLPFSCFMNKCLKCVIYIVSGLVLYWAIWHITLRTMGISKVKYSGTNTVGIASFFQNVSQYFKRPIWIFISYYRDDPLFGNCFWLILIILATFSGVFLVILNLKYKRIWAVPVAVIIAGFIPVGANIIDIIVPDHGVQLYMTFQMQMLAPFCTSIILLAVKSMSKSLKAIQVFKKGITGVTGFLIVGLVWGYCFQAYSSFRTVELGSSHIRYYIGNTLTHALEDDLYKSDMPIVFLGFVSDDQVQELNPLHRYSYFDNAYPFWKDKYEVFSTWRNYCIYNFGVDIGTIAREKYDTILKSPEFLKMEQYPSKKAYAVIDGCYVILLDKATVRE